LRFIKKTKESGGKGCPTYPMDYAGKKSTTCVSAGRVLPPLAGSAYGMTSSAMGVFLKPLLLFS